MTIMNVVPQAQPAAGSTRPGDLYVDQQSLQLWLGVPLSVDSSGSQLVCDFQAIEPALVAAVEIANEYTRQQVALRAPINNPVLTGNPQAPTASVSSDSTAIATTAFVKKAIAAAPVPNFFKGMIVMWSGKEADIGTGALAGWALCNGYNGTPDLRNRFVMYSSVTEVGKVNTPVAASTSESPEHTHTVSAVSLSINQMPAHNHVVNSVTKKTYTTAKSGLHNHTLGLARQSGTPGTFYAHTATGPTEWASDSGGEHQHTVEVNFDDAVYTCGNQGLGATHTHTTVGAGKHVHTVQPTEVRDAIPHFCLAYIMRIID